MNTAAEQRQSADEMAEGQEPFGGEIAVGELVAEEDAEHRGDARSTLPTSACCHAVKPSIAHVGEDLRQPGAPDEDLEDHHDEKFEAGGAGHAAQGLGSATDGGKPAGWARRPNNAVILSGAIAESKDL